MTRLGWKEVQRQHLADGETGGTSPTLRKTRRSAGKDLEDRVVGVLRVKHRYVQLKDSDLLRKRSCVCRAPRHTLNGYILLEPQASQAECHPQFLQGTENVNSYRGEATTCYYPSPIRKIQIVAFSFYDVSLPFASIYLLVFSACVGKSVPLLWQLLMRVLLEVIKRRRRFRLFCGCHLIIEPIIVSAVHGAKIWPCCSTFVSRL